MSFYLLRRHVRDRPNDDARFCQGALGRISGHLLIALLQLRQAKVEDAVGSPSSWRDRDHASDGIVTLRSTRLSVHSGKISQTSGKFPAASRLAAALRVCPTVFGGFFEPLRGWQLAFRVPSEIAWDLCLQRSLAHTAWSTSHEHHATLATRIGCDGRRARPCGRRVRGMGRDDVASIRPYLIAEPRRDRPAPRPLHAHVRRGGATPRAGRGTT